MDIYPEEVYENLFRFQKRDIDLLISVLELPPVMTFETRHKTNRFVVFNKETVAIVYFQL